MEFHEKNLAEKLVDFYKEFDFYGFRDTLEVGETEEDAVNKLTVDLQYPQSVDNVISELEDIASEAEDEERIIAKQLIEELKLKKQDMIKEKNKHAEQN